jgi:hypothetical protein
VTEPPAAAPPPPSSDPNYILSQEEFHTTIRQLSERQLAGELTMHKRIAVEVDSLVETFGWIAISLAFWLLLVGWTMIRGEVRGRP